MSEKFEKRASSVAEKVASILDSQIKDSARQKDWTVPVGVESNNGKVNLVYGSQHQGDIINLEYGSKEQAPKAVIRPFLTGSEKVISEQIQVDALDYLFEEGILP